MADEEKDMVEAYRSAAWIEAHSPINYAKLHAMGYITFMWNRCEADRLFILHALLGEMNEEVFFSLFHDAPQQTIEDKIKSQVVGKKLPLEMQEVISHYMKYFNICRLNRNQLTHFAFEQIQDDIRLKRLKGPSSELHDVDDSIESIRRVAEEIQLLSENLLKIHTSIMLDGKVMFRNPIEGYDPMFYITSPFPYKFSLPERLWKPHPKDPQQSTPPDRSSRT